MKRHLFSLVCIVSLLLCVSFAGLWVRSFWRVDEKTFSFSRSRIRGIYSARGSLCFELWGKPDRDGKWPDYDEDPFRTRPLQNDRLWWEEFERVGLIFRYAETAPFMDRDRGVFPIVVVPYALPTIVLGLLPACLLVSWLRRKRALSRGRCPTCGYDLRATPDRCPECGMVRAAE